MEDGQMDNRFQEDQQQTIELIGLEAIDVLSDFKQRKTDLQNKYGGAALKLCHVLLNAFHTLIRIKKT